MDALVVDTNDIVLAEHAAVIKALGKRVARDIVEIGYRLTLCKIGCGHGEWLPWLDHEFGWDERTAQRFMDVHALVGKNDKLSDLDIPVSGLYLLAAPNTPDEVIDQAVERAEQGETLSVAKVKEMIADARAVDLAAAEERYAKLQAKYEKREQELREEQSTLLSKTDAEKIVEQALQPLLKKLANAKKVIERLRKPPTQGDKIRNKFGTAPVAIDMALEGFVERLTIGPADVIEHQKMITATTGQTMKAGLAQKTANAKRAVAWLKKFLALAGRVK